MSAAKALALAADLPYVGVNHLEAHLHAAWLEDPDLEPPLAVLIVSGGHTMIVVMEDHGRYRVLGQTVDDAAGEAFDKVARFLGLGYPGGPAIDRLARDGDPAAIRFPRPMRGDGRLLVLGAQDRGGQPRPPRARTSPSPTSPRRSRRRSSTCSWRSCVAAADEAGAPVLALGGGVAANSRLRAKVAEAAAATGRSVFLPPPSLCTDNGAMIAATAWWRLRGDGPTPLDARRRPQPPPADSADLGPVTQLVGAGAVLVALALALAEC